MPTCEINLSEIFNRFLPQPSDNNPVPENFSLKDRLLSFDSTTGVGMFDFGSYNERLKGNCKLSPQTTVPSNTVNFNVCMSLVQLLVATIL